MYVHMFGFDVAIENDAEAGINYLINREWDAGLKYGYSEATLDNSSFEATDTGNALMLTFANSFSN